MPVGRRDEPFAPQPLSTAMTAPRPARLPLQRESAASTARSCASSSAPEVRSSAIANNTLTDFGAEIVKSSAATVEHAPIGRSTERWIGCCPRIKATNALRCTRAPDDRPRGREPLPRRPGASPRPEQ